MMTPVVSDVLEVTVGKVVDRLTDRYLPSAMGEKEREELKIEARRLALGEFEVAVADVRDARSLAGVEAGGAPAWTRVLTVTHRPAWSFLTLGIFAWTVLAPYLGYPHIPLTDTHKAVMQTVIIFYFGGRSVEKALSHMRER